MSQFSAKSSSNAALPDFENNLAEFESDFLKYVSDADPKFDFNLLRYPMTQLPGESNMLTASDSIYPKFKRDLNQLVKITAGRSIMGDIWGTQVLIENNVRVQGSIYSVKDAVLGENCVVEGSVVAGARLTLSEGCQVEGTVVAAEIGLNGKIVVEGPVYSRGDLVLNGSLEAQELLAGSNIQLNGEPGDEVVIEAATIFAQNGEIDIKLPLMLGLSKRKADLQLQKFYLSRASDGTFRLARSLGPMQDGMRPAQGTLITNLSDAELERLLADLNVSER